MMRDPRRLAESFVAEVKGAVADRLRAVLLFGSAARGEWIDGVSDVNVLVLVDSLDTALLASTAPAAAHALEQGVMPLLMEQDEWRRAEDVFAIELADMRQHGVALLGENPAASAQVEPTVLRLQAERELRGKLLHLHGGMLVAAAEPERLGTLFMRALPSFTTYMRAVLRLVGRPVAEDSGVVIEDACAVVGADAEPFRTVLAARRSGGGLRVELKNGGLADRFNASATRFATFIDAFEG
jgi:predicted nucleotidyltransferase